MTNRYLIGAIIAELLLATVFVYAPPLQSLLGTAPPPAQALVLLIGYPLVVWGADELRRLLLRRRDRGRDAQPGGGAGRVLVPEHARTAGR